MAHTLKDLAEVMEDESAGGTPPPDLLDDVRHRVRRGNRRRAGAGALGAALVVGASFGVAGQWDGTAAPAPGHRQQALAGAMTGTPDDTFRQGRPVEGMRPLTEVRYTQFGRLARLTFTPTGPFTMYTTRCTDGRAYQVKNEDLASSGCGGATYLATKPGVPVTIQVAVLPTVTAQQLGDIGKAAGLYEYLAAHRPTPGNWSVRIYSGQCDSHACEVMTSARTSRPRPPVTGLKRLARATGTADGRARPVRLTPSGTALRIRLTCLDGAAVAVLRYADRADVVACEAAESEGVVRDLQAKGDGLEIAVLPAEAGKVRDTDDADLTRLMKGVRPAGTWTLEVYAR